MKLGDLVQKRKRYKIHSLFLVIEVKTTTHFKPQQRIRLARCSDGLQSPWINPVNYEVLNGGLNA